MPGKTLRVELRQTSPEAAWNGQSQEILSEQIVRMKTSPMLAQISLPHAIVRLLNSLLAKDNAF